MANYISSYTGLQIDDSISKRHIQGTDSALATGLASEVTAVDLRALLDKDHVFLSETNVAPAVAGEPTLAEIQALITANSITSTTAYYTADNIDDVNNVKYAYAVSGMGEAVLIYEKFYNKVNLAVIDQDLATTSDVTFNNISPSGTVDGRDIATDGATLDQMETIVHGIFDLGNENLITINADTTKYDVAPFEYYINGTKYSFAGETGRASGFTSGDNFMVINIGTAGIIELTKDTFNDSSTLANAIELGRIATQDGTNISYAGQSHFDADTFMKDTYIWAKTAKGTDYIGTALSVSENSTTPLQIDTASGSLIDPQLRPVTVSASQNVSAVPYYHVSGNWDFGNTVSPLVVSNSQYDNGTDLVTISNNKWMSHTLLRSASTGTIYYVPSQGEYGTEAEAIDADPSFGGFDINKATDVSYLASIIIQEGSTSIDTIIDRRNQTSNVVSASTSTLQTTYDRSSTPEIITNTTAGALTIQGGTGTDTENLIEGRNNAGTLTSYIKADGTSSFDQVASEVPNTAVGNLTSTNVQASLEELQTDIDNLNTISIGSNSTSQLANGVQTVFTTAFDLSPNTTLVFVGLQDSLTLVSSGYTVNLNDVTFNTAPADGHYVYIASFAGAFNGGSGGSAWGSLTGVLSTQTDLQSELDTKQNILPEGAFTAGDKTKLDNLTDSFKGYFADATARDVAVPSPVDGDYVIQNDTDSLWYYNGVTWIDTGSTATGDMLKSIYDPSNIADNVYDVDNHISGVINKVYTASEQANSHSPYVIGTKVVDENNLADGFMLEYNSTSGNLEYHERVDVTFTANDGQTVFTLPTPWNKVVVHVNGIIAEYGYTYNSGTGAITFTLGLNDGDILRLRKVS